MRIMVEVLVFAVAFVLGYMVGHRNGVERTRALSAGNVGNANGPPEQPRGR